ncbi:MAG: DUF1820 family protein [Desulfuromonadales bacterium]|jgi:hypothetical protein
MSEKPRTLYRIFFSSQGKAYEIYARNVTQADVYGFVAIEDLLFGEKSSIVVDPNEEALKTEFAGVKRLLIPYHAVSRIDEVEKAGQAKVIALAGGETGSGARTPPPPTGGDGPSR